MAKLNQILAVLPNKKETAKDALTKAYHALQKEELFKGLSRTYQPNDDNGETQPAERKMPQMRIGDLVKNATTALGDMMDTVATQDWANCQACANVVVGDKVLAEKVPVTHLLFLEKQIVDLRTFIEKIPTLDPAEEWSYSSDKDCYVTAASQTNRSKKVPKTIVKYEATKEHPAQVELFHEDVHVGTWTNVKFSSAIPAKDKNAMLERLTKLSEAVKTAREEANSALITQRSIGSPLLSYVFQGQ